MDLIEEVAKETSELIHRAEEMGDPELDAILRDMKDKAKEVIRRKLMEEEKIKSRAKELHERRRRNPNGFIVVNY